MSAETIRTSIETLKPAAQSASIAVTSTASVGLQIPVGSTRLKLTNLGPNEAYACVSGNSADVAAVPTGAFAIKGIPVNLNEPYMIVDLQSISNAGAFLSLVCVAAKTATVLVTVW